MNARSIAGGLGVGFAVGWNIAALGAIATRLSHAYDVRLALVGVFVTVQFIVHLVMQIPGGRMADRFGAQRSALVGVAFLAAGNALSLIAPEVALAFAGRAIVGLGTGIAFVSGSDYFRARGGTMFHQGVYGSASVLAPGIALVVVPAVPGFRSPYLTGVVVAALAFVVLATAPRAARTARHAGDRLRAEFFRDTRLYRFGAIHALSFGFSVVIGNWVVTLLEHHGQSKGAAAAVGSLTLLLGFFGRIAGGRLISREWTAGSLVAGGLAAIVLATPVGLAGDVAATTVLGLAAGIPFAKAFAGAAAARPDAPGAAIGLVNALASFVIVVGAPLVGLTFSLPGDGRIGFVAMGVLAALAALAAPR